MEYASLLPDYTPISNFKLQSGFRRKSESGRKGGTESPTTSSQVICPAPGKCVADICTAQKMTWRRLEKTIGLGFTRIAVRWPK